MLTDSHHLEESNLDGMSDQLVSVSNGQVLAVACTLVVVANAVACTLVVAANALQLVSVSNGQVLAKNALLVRL